MIVWELTDDELDQIDPRCMVLALTSPEGQMSYRRGDSVLGGNARGQWSDVLRAFIAEQTASGVHVTLLAGDQQGHMFPVSIPGSVEPTPVSMVSTEPPTASREVAEVQQIPDLDTLARMICAHLDILGKTKFVVNYVAKGRRYRYQCQPNGPDAGLN